MLARNPSVPNVGIAIKDDEWDRLIIKEVNSIPKLNCAFTKIVDM